MQEKIKYKTPLLMLKHSRSFVHHLLWAENKAEKKKKNKRCIVLLLFIIVLYFQGKIRE